LRKVKWLADGAAQDKLGGGIGERIALKRLRNANVLARIEQAPATMARMIFRPVTPLISLMT